MKGCRTGILPLRAGKGGPEGDITDIGAEDEHK
jgi:hypothetical protein